MRSTDKIASNFQVRKRIANLEKADLLSVLAYKYESDRCPQIKHPFTPYYYELLKDKRLSIKKVLEIGVGYREMDPWRSYCTGAGLHMWREFFPNAQIYGADNDPRAVMRAERIQTFLCDQANNENLLTLINQSGPDLDLVIDDGSHKTEDQISTCLTLMPIINKNVIYIVEDVKEPDKIATALSMYNCQVPPFRRRFRDDNVVVVTNKR